MVITIPDLQGIRDRVRSFFRSSSFRGGVYGDSPRFVIPEFSYAEAKRMKRSNALVSTQINKNTQNIVGSSHYYTPKNEDNPLEILAKDTLEKYSRVMKLHQKHKQIAEELQVTGNAYAEKVYSDYGGPELLSPDFKSQLLEMSMIPEKFVKVPREDAACLGISRILPSEYMRPISNASGDVIAYVFAFGQPVYYLAKEIIHYAINVPSGQATGVGLIEPVYTEARRLDRIIELLPLIVENYAEPRRIYKAPDKITAHDFQRYMETLETGEEPVLYGNMELIKTEVSGESKFIDYIYEMTGRIQEHLAAPRQGMLQQATEASARVLLQDYLPFITDIQNIIREHEEEELLKPLLLNHQEFYTIEEGEKKLKPNLELPFLNFGERTSGLENIDKNEILQKSIDLGMIDIIDLLRKLKIPVNEITPEQREAFLASKARTSTNTSDTEDNEAKNTMAPPVFKPRYSV